jgi:hypothetical protein
VGNCKAQRIAVKQRHSHLLTAAFFACSDLAPELKSPDEFDEMSDEKKLDIANSRFIGRVFTASVRLSWDSHNSRSADSSFCVNVPQSTRARQGDVNHIPSLCQPTTIHVPEVRPHSRHADDMLSSPFCSFDVYELSKWVELPQSWRNKTPSPLENARTSERTGSSSAGASFFSSPQDGA